MKISGKVLAFAALIAIVVLSAFQNCAPVLEGGVGGVSRQFSPGNGAGYEGQVPVGMPAKSQTYVMHGTCGDGTAVVSIIIKTGSVYEMTRENCAPLDPSRVLDSMQIIIDTNNPNQLTYQGQTFELVTESSGG